MMEQRACLDSQLHGAPNFREVGRLRSTDGRRLRQRRVYRSESLHRLTAEDVDRLRALRIRTAFDLRTAGEREGHVSRWPADAKPEVRRAESRAAELGSLIEQIEAALHSSPQALRSLMTDSYRAMPEAFAGTIAEVATTLASTRDPVLVHCAAGKDRTGVVCGILLLTVGIPYDDVERDYLVSNRHYGPERIAEGIVRITGSEPDREAVEALAVRPEYLRAAVAGIDARYGSLAAYLEACAGLGPRERAELQDALLEEPPASS
jgi:protein-tyrosine phosphatase